MSKATKQEQRKKRQTRIRKKIVGSLSKPRMNVTRSNLGIFVQLIDDAAGKTLVSVSSKESELQKKFDSITGLAVAREVGRIAAERAKEQGIEQIVFDRGGYRYHGRVKVLADSAREAGLIF